MGKKLRLWTGKGKESRIFEDERYYICHDGRELRHVRTETKEQDGYTQTFEVYGCADCDGCEHKARFLYKYDAEKDAEKRKVMKVNEWWEELKEESHAIGRNINKYHRFVHGKLQKFEGKTEQEGA